MAKKPYYKLRKHKKKFLNNMTEENDHIKNLR